MAACHCFQSSDGRRDPASVSVSCASSSCASHGARGSARHGCAALVGADVLGGPRGRIVLRRRPCACGGRAAEDVRPYHVYGPARHMMRARPCTPRLCGVGRGRRPRRPAWTHRPPASSLCVRGAGGRGRPPLPCMRPCAPRLRGPARHGCAALVGADVLGGPRGRIVHRRRPSACGGRAAGDVRPYHVYGPARHMICAALRVRPYHVRASARVTARVCAVRGTGDAGAGNGGGSFRSGRCGRACRFPSKGRTGRH